MKTCQETIEKIITLAAESGQTLTEAELLSKLDHIDGFWDQAFYEDFDILDYIPEQASSAKK